jgi:hypothetical protein
MKTVTNNDEFKLATPQDALMAEITAVRLKGEIRGLFEKIAELRYRITGQIFEHVIQGERYCQLEMAMEEAQVTLDIMKVYFKELRGLDPSQK